MSFPLSNLSPDVMFRAYTDYKLFARKIIRVFANVTTDDIINEARTLDSLCAGNQHPNLVSVIEHSWLSNTWLYYIDMELCSYDLGQYMKQTTASRWVNALSVADSVFVLEQLISVMLIADHIASGLKYIHDCGEVHRDIKPSNGIL